MSVQNRVAAPARTSLLPKVAVVLCVVLSVLVMVAGTHGETVNAQAAPISLESIDPADGSSLDVSPETITLAFSRVVADDEVVAVSVKCQELHRVGLPELKRNVATVAVPTPLPKGACSIEWLVKDGVGQVIASGTSTVQIKNPPPASASTAPASVTIPAAPTPAPVTAENGTPGGAGGAVWLGQFISSVGIMLAVGAIALMSVGWPEGPEYVISARYVRITWGIALVGTLLYVLALNAQVGGVSVASGLSPLNWGPLVGDGWAGRGALLRLLAVIGLGWLALLPERIHHADTALIGWGFALLSVIATAMARVEGPVALLGLLIVIVHVFTFSVWFGGAGLVGRVVLSGAGEYDLVRATKVFCRVSVPAMLAVAVTHVVEVLRLDGGGLFTSGHGRVSLLKTVALAAMLLVALKARQEVMRRLARADFLEAHVAARFRRAFSAEVAIGVIVLALSGAMLGLTPANANPLTKQEFAREVAFVDAVTQISASVSVGPGTVGKNALKVVVASPSEGVQRFVLTFTPPYGADAFEIVQSIPVDGPGTYFVSASNGLPFAVVGEWQVRLEASTTTGVLEPQTQAFLVVDEDGTVPSTSVPAATPSSVKVDVAVVPTESTIAPFAEDTNPPESTEPTNP